MADGNLEPLAACNGIFTSVHGDLITTILFQACIMCTSLHLITNGLLYSELLINCGPLTFRIDAEAMSNWFHHDHHG